MFGNVGSDVGSGEEAGAGSGAGSAGSVEEAMVGGAGSFLRRLPGFFTEGGGGGIAA